MAAVTLWHALPTFLWLMPIVSGLIVSIPFSIVTGSTQLGKRLKTWGILLIPEETDPPPILIRQRAFLAQYAVAASPDSFQRLVWNPALLGIHIAMPRENTPPLWSPARKAGDASRLLLLQHAEALRRLHFDAWKNLPVERLLGLARTVRQEHQDLVDKVNAMDEVDIEMRS